MNTVQASSSATLLVSMMISLNLRRIEKSRKARISVASSPSVLNHTPCQGQQLGAELQPGARRRICVDFKPHFVAFEDEIHGSARLDKVGHLTDGQHARPFQAI